MRWTKRAVTSPNSFDLIDTEFFSLKKIVPTGNLKGIDTKRIKNADKITSLFTKGKVNGKKVGDQGTAPKKVIYLEGEKSKVFAKSPTQFMSLIPTVYNADTLGIRPDLIKRPIDSWAKLLNPEFKGKAAILNIPSIGIMDAAMVVEDKLGQVYGVSRTRIRQVLIRLAQAQVVTLSPNCGTSVAQPSVQETREVFEVRRLIEPTLLQRAIQRATEADLQALAAQIAQEEQARADGQRGLALHLSGEFHLQLATLADHATLARLLVELVSRTSLILMAYGSAAPQRQANQHNPARPEHPARWVDACNCHEHRGLLAALRLRDAAAAQALMLQHLDALEATLCFNLPEPGPGLVALLGGGAGDGPRDGSRPGSPPHSPSRRRTGA